MPDLPQSRFNRRFGGHSQKVRRAEEKSRGSQLRLIQPPPPGLRRNDPRLTWVSHETLLFPANDASLALAALSTQPYYFSNRKTSLYFDWREEVAND
jgi:hypothetical protein